MKSTALTLKKLPPNLIVRGETESLNVVNQLQLLKNVQTEIDTTLIIGSLV